MSVMDIFQKIPEHLLPETMQHMSCYPFLYDWKSYVAPGRILQMMQSEGNIKDYAKQMFTELFHNHHSDVSDIFYKPALEYRNGVNTLLTPHRAILQDRMFNRFISLNGENVTALSIHDRHIRPSTSRLVGQKCSQLETLAYSHFSILTSTLPDIITENTSGIQELHLVKCHILDKDCRAITRNLRLLTKLYIGSSRLVGEACNEEFWYEVGKTLEELTFEENELTSYSHHRFRFIGKHCRNLRVIRYRPFVRGHSTLFDTGLLQTIVDRYTDEGEYDAADLRNRLCALEALPAFAGGRCSQSEREKEYRSLMRLLSRIRASEALRSFAGSQSSQSEEEKEYSNLMDSSKSEIEEGRVGSPSPSYERFLEIRASEGILFNPDEAADTETWDSDEGSEAWETDESEEETDYGSGDENMDVELDAAAIQALREKYGLGEEEVRADDSSEEEEEEETDNERVEVALFMQQRDHCGMLIDPREGEYRVLESEAITQMVISLRNSLERICLTQCENTLDQLSSMVDACPTAKFHVNLGLNRVGLSVAEVTHCVGPQLIELGYPHMVRFEDREDYLLPVCRRQTDRRKMVVSNRCENLERLKIHVHSYSDCDNEGALMGAVRHHSTSITHFHLDCQHVDTQEPVFENIMPMLYGFTALRKFVIDCPFVKPWAFEPIASTNDFLEEICISVYAPFSIYYNRPYRYTNEYSMEEAIHGWVHGFRRNRRLREICIKQKLFQHPPKNPPRFFFKSVKDMCKANFQGRDMHIEILKVKYM